MPSCAAAPRSTARRCCSSAGRERPATRSGSTSSPRTPTRGRRGSSTARWPTSARCSTSTSAPCGPGGSTGLPPSEETLHCVCTNGRHDACCAEFGRPVAMALDAARPEETWEVSHIGGDRFAGNLVVLPEGLYYGRLDVGAGLAVADAHGRRRLLLDHLRGRSSYPMPVQAAEIHLLRHLGLDGVDDLTLVRRRVDGDVTTATFAAPRRRPPRGAGAHDQRPVGRAPAHLQGAPAQPGAAPRCARGRGR
ncbi:hypothetical protein MF408_05660 [Nocardioides sp. TF02-7]|nr:sucrase ferredoxin [Nocardioides sp. TF02-7]UMG93670.1 hypothetical protein MF408_05660 [Nocardioides sp. TF02-7]